MGETRKAENITLGKVKWKIPLGRPRCRWVNNKCLREGAYDLTTSTQSPVKCFSVKSLWIYGGRRRGEFNLELRDVAWNCWKNVC